MPVVFVLFASLVVIGQTSSFTYQGKLTDTNINASGPYDFVFRLYDSALNGTQIGPSVFLDDVNVGGGIFTVTLDFGTVAFTNGAQRFIQIEVRQGASVGAFTILSPRQPITSAPHSIKSLNADNATTATTATNFTGSLAGDVIGTQNATFIPFNTITTTKLADSSVTTGKLADSAVNATKIANGQVVRSVNGLTDGVVLAAGSNITITPSGNFLTIATTGGGGGNSILNQTSQQSGANFNIDGVGTANTFNAVSQYNINGAGRILSSAGSNNLFVGIAAGNANPTGGGNTFTGGGSGSSTTSGTNNSFFGANAGSFNSTAGSNSFFGAAAGFFTSGSENSFFGASAGQSNTTGTFNSFFGKSAGESNGSASSNSFFGYNTGQLNTGGLNSFVGAFAGSANLGGSENSFFGYTAGNANRTGSSNAFFGKSAGLLNTASDNSFFGTNAGLNTASGGNNSFFGKSVGLSNISGSNNTLIGSGSNVSASNLTNATAIGYNAIVSQNDSLVLGSSGTKVGIGTSSPGERLTVQTATTNYGFVHTDGTVTVGSFVGGSTGGGFFGTKSNHPFSLFVNNGAPSLTINANGTISIPNLAVGGGNAICLQSSFNLLGYCSSSLRYKTNIEQFVAGMSFVDRLRPIAYDWKNDGTKDTGFAAEEVEKIDTRFVTYNNKGEVEGVKYDRLGVVFVNALKEQQEQIEIQQKQINQLLRANAAMNTRLMALEKRMRNKRSTRKNR